MIYEPQQTIEEMVHDSLRMDDSETYADCGDAEEATTQIVEERIGRELTENEHSTICEMVEAWWILNN